MHIPAAVHVHSLRVRAGRLTRPFEDGAVLRVAHVRSDTQHQVITNRVVHVHIHLITNSASRSHRIIRTLQGLLGAIHRRGRNTIELLHAGAARHARDGLAPARVGAHNQLIGGRRVKVHRRHATSGRTDTFTFKGLRRRLTFRMFSTRFARR